MKKILKTSSPFAALALGIACTTACTITPDDNGNEGEGEGEGEVVDLSDISADLTIDENTTASGDINVNNGATLTIAPGVTIRLGSGHWLRVEDGVLKAEGTEDEPITIRGVDDGAGRFLGVELSDGTRSGTSLSFVTIDGGGGEGFGARGCLLVDGVPADRVSLADLTLKNCEDSALRLVGTTAPLAVFDRISIAASLVGVAVDAALIGEIDETITAEGVTRHEIVGGDVGISSTIVKQTSPFHVSGDLNVEGTGAPVLTIAAGNTLRFASNKWLGIGGDGAGGLVSAGTAEAPVVLGSVDGGTATKGAWLGVRFQRDTLSDSSLTHTRVESAGQEGFSMLGCITVTGVDGNRVALVDVTVAKCGLAGIGVDGNTDPFSAFDRVTIDDATVGISAGIHTFASIDEAPTLTAVTRHEITDAVMSEDVTLVKQTVPFIITRDFNVDGGATLTIEAGNELRFGSNFWLGIGINAGGGRVVADGTAASPVVLGSIDTGSTGGAWLGVRFDDETLSGTRLTNTIVKQAGGEGSGMSGGVNVFGGGSNVTLDSVTFEDNDQADVFLRCGEEPTLINTTGAVVDDC